MTAENEQDGVNFVTQLFLASMRPRPMTAENARPADRRARPGPASMRPRPMTAENCSKRSGPPARSTLQ